jgi:hypothetical protein
VRTEWAAYAPLQKVVDHPVFEAFAFLCVLVNAALLLLYAGYDTEALDALEIANVTLLVMFNVEVCFFCVCVCIFIHVQTYVLHTQT